MSHRTLRDAAEVIRSKNAGPCVLSLDIIFKNRQEYEALKTADFFSRQLLADLYTILPDQILDVIYFDPASAVKVTLARPVICGDPGETDIYGAQQHGPLLDIPLPDRKE